MPRKRMIDPEFWSDEEIGSWSHSARLLYIGLWNFADDSGRFKAHGNLLKSQIFPYDKSVNVTSLKKELGNKIQWYSANSFQYGHIRNFLKYQRIDRPTESKLPIPPPFDESSMIPQRDVLPNIREVKLSKEKGSKEEKYSHLDCITLTNNELNKLHEKYGKKTTDNYIFKVNNWKMSKGKTTKSDYHTILTWINKDGIQDQKSRVDTNTQEFEDKLKKWKEESGQ